MHINCELNKIDVTDWPVGTEKQLECNIGLHNDLSMLDWLLVKVNYAGPDATDPSTWSCVDSYQMADDDGIFGGQEIATDEYQNCYLFSE